MKIFVDFETRSKVDLRKHGIHRYAEDPSTVPLMLAYGHREQQEQWILGLPYRPEDPPACPAKLVGLIENPGVEFHAHNAAFEIAIWNYICVQRWGWPEIALDRWHCTAAKAAAANLPRALDDVTTLLGVVDKKDKTGKALIKQLSKPVKAQKTVSRIRKDKNGKSIKGPDGRVIRDVNKFSQAYAEEKGWPLFEGDHPDSLYFFNEDPQLMAAFARYNLQDIKAEMAAHAAIPAPHELEQPLWILDREINQRGIPVDLDLCRGAVAVYNDALGRANAEVEILTDGAVERLTMRDRMLAWITEQGVNWGETLREEDVTLGLKMMDLPDKVRRVLELRQLAGGSAVKKYKATLDAAQMDGRVRDQLLYYGATTTGRWAGRGIQPHNFKRAKTLHEDFIETIKLGDVEQVQALAELCGMTVQQILNGCLRGIVQAPPGRLLLFSDFAGIESRVLNWLTGNEKKLQLFREGQDAYIHTALDVYDVVNEAAIANWSEEKGKWIIKPEHKEKRQIGKACELGLGYNMGWPKFQEGAARAGSKLSDEFACEVVNKWRAANPQIPRFWQEIQEACWTVVAKRRPNRAIRLGPLKVFLDSKNYLCIELPSGRRLRYYQPQITQDKRPLQEGENPEYSRVKLFYRDGGKKGHGANKFKIDTYGGKLTENIVQAISRDLLVHSMMIIRAARIPIVFHVHDEVVCEISEHDTKSFGIVHQAMETVPTWAQGLPLEAETQTSRRFTK